MILTHVSRNVYGSLTPHVVNQRSLTSGRLTQQGRRYCWVLMYMGVMYMSMMFGVHRVAWADCPSWESTPKLGGPADAVVNVQEADRWRRYRAQRESERRLEARSPERVRRRYRLEHTQITDGCITTDQLVDLGRNLFLRRFSRAEG